MKLNRNVVPAREKAAENARKKREELRERIRSKVLPFRADNCQSIGGCNYCQAHPIRGCIMYSNLAKVLNELGIPTLSGDQGSWEKEKVKRLFRDDNGPTRDASGEEIITLI